MAGIYVCLFYLKDFINPLSKGFMQNALKTAKINSYLKHLNHEHFYCQSTFVVYACIFNEYVILYAMYAYIHWGDVIFKLDERTTLQSETAEAILRR